MTIPAPEETGRRPWPPAAVWAVTVGAGCVFCVLLQAIAFTFLIQIVFSGARSTTPVERRAPGNAPGNAPAAPNAPANRPPGEA